MTILVPTDPRPPANPVPLSSRAEELFEDRVVKETEEVECLVLDGRFVGRVGSGRPHEMQQALETCPVGRVAPLEPLEQERLNATHQPDVGRRPRFGRVRGEHEHDVGRRRPRAARLRSPRAFPQSMGAIGVLADVHKFEIHGVGSSHGGALGRGEAPQPRACPAERGTVPLPNRHHVEPDRLDRGIELLAFGSDHHMTQCGLDDFDQALELACQPLALRCLFRHASSACIRLNSSSS